MLPSFKQFGLHAISGGDTSLLGKVLRVVTGLIEPFYSAAMRLRNAGYDRKIFRSHDLGRFTISVGNITTGGTGKTPVVKWLSEQMQHRGRHPAILLRGYGSKPNQLSDEAQLLAELQIPVQVNPSRVEGAAGVLRGHPQTDVFILDDAFQHRRAGRDFNLVLISATQPFGFGHVLPRGLLREPLVGLGRADAFLITRCSLVSSEAVGEIDRIVRQWNATAPIYHADHLHSQLSMPAIDERIAIESLAGEKVFLTAGIGDPIAFAKQIDLHGAVIVGTRWFSDHHPFSLMDIQSLLSEAKRSGASRVITTEKDWVKIRSCVSSIAVDPPFAVVQMEIVFWQSDWASLLTDLETAKDRLRTHRE